MHDLLSQALISRQLRAHGTPSERLPHSRHGSFAIFLHTGHLVPERPSSLLTSHLRTSVLRTMDNAPVQHTQGEATEAVTDYLHLRGPDIANLHDALMIGETFSGPKGKPGYEERWG